MKYGPGSLSHKVKAKVRPLLTGCVPCSFIVRSMNFESVTYCSAVSIGPLNSPSNVSRAHCSVCSIALGKFFSVQIGIDFSGGSREEEYDSDK